MMGTLNFLFENEGYLTPTKSKSKSVPKRYKNYKQKEYKQLLISPQLLYPKLAPLKPRERVSSKPEASSQDYETEEMMITTKLSEARELIESYKGRKSPIQNQIKKNLDISSRLLEDLHRSTQDISRYLLNEN